MSFMLQAFIIFLSPDNNPIVTYTIPIVTSYRRFNPAHVLAFFFSRASNDILGVSFYDTSFLLLWPATKNRARPKRHLDICY